MLTGISLIVLSAFAVLGIFHFVSTVMDLVFSPGIGRAVAVVPVSSPDMPLDEVLRAMNTVMPGKSTVVVDICGGIEAECYVKKGMCAVVTTPENLSETLWRIIR